MKCPNCGSTNCKFITHTKIHTKSFGTSEACCGMLLLGPFGILCGLCGRETDSKIKEFWICNDCGQKFSPKEAKKFMEEEAHRLKKFLFYAELQANDVSCSYRNKQGEQIKALSAQYLCEFLEEQKAFCSNPPFENSEFELMKTKCSDVLTEKDLVYLVLVDSGIVIADKGLVFANIFFSSAGKIRKYKNCIYMDAFCVRVSNEERAEKLYHFLIALYEPGSIEDEKEYSCYEEILEELQQCRYYNTDEPGHFSSQPEYEVYVNQIKKEGMELFASCDRTKYTEYQSRKEAFDRWDANTSKIIIALLLLSIIIGLLGGVVSGVIVFIISLVMFEVIKRDRKKYTNEILPQYLLAVLSEERREPAEKTGKISVDYYRKIFQAQRNSMNKKRVCKNCYHELKQEWKVCPFCGQKQ